MDADPRFRAIAGNIVLPGFTAPKLAWIRRHEPAIFARVAKVLLPKDYLRLWLTGEHVSEMSDAAGTVWLDTGARDWSDALLEATGHDPRRRCRGWSKARRCRARCGRSSPRASVCRPA